jgi:hypothetical protein
VDKVLACSPGEDNSVVSMHCRSESLLLPSIFACHGMFLGSFRLLPPFDMLRAVFLWYWWRRPCRLGRSEPNVEGDVLGEKYLMEPIEAGSRYH